MKKFKTDQIVLLISIIMTMVSGKSQDVNIVLPKVENHLIGELDYTHEALELIQSQADGTEASLGKIDTTGTVNFNLQEYDIKALYDSINLQHVKFQDWFSINSSCKDRDVFAKTPFDDVYSQKTKAIWVKKYGIKVAVLEAASDKVKLRNQSDTKDSVDLLNEYYWFYIDRAISYKDACQKISYATKETNATIEADLSFKKGWNFIEENTTWDLNYDQTDPNSTQLKQTYFTKSEPAAKKVKWKLRQVAENDKIELAKKLHNLIPITKERFEKWTPSTLGDLSAKMKEHGTSPLGRKNKNNIHLIYSNKNKEIELYIVDCANSPDDLEMVNFAYAMENDGKEAKDKKPYVAQYNEREKITKLLYKVEDRIFVSASSTNIKGEQLWEYIRKLKVEKLLKK